MKYLHLLPFLCCFSQVFTQRVILREYRDYVKLNAQTKTLLIEFNDVAKDSCYQYGLDFSSFQYLEEAALLMEKPDSLFESYVYKKLSHAENLTHLSITTDFKHDFSAFNKLQHLWLMGKGGLMNPSVASLNFTSIEIGIVDVNLISASDPIFQMKSIREVIISELPGGPFPLECLSQMEGPLSIRTYNTPITSISALCQGFKKSLSLSIVRGSIIDTVPSCICEMNLSQLFITSTHCPVIPACIFDKEDLQISISVKTNDRSEIRKVKRYSRQIKEDPYRRKRITFYSYKD